MDLNTAMKMIRWRLNDPAEESKQRWTTVHALHPGTSATATGRYGILTPSDDEVTLCGRIVPAHPYMEDRDEQVPADSPRCQRCAARTRKFSRMSLGGR